MEKISKVRIPVVFPTINLTEWMNEECFFVVICYEEEFLWEVDDNFAKAESSNTLHTFIRAKSKFNKK